MTRAGPPDLTKANGAECENTPLRFCFPAGGCALSNRQRAVLGLAARGLLDREIGATLGVAGQTVRHHLQATRMKLKARNTTHAVAIALTQNLISLEDMHHEDEGISDDRVDGIPIGRVDRRGGRGAG